MDNALYCGDNLEVLPLLKKDSVDLIYIDPPFFSHKHYEIVWRDEAEIRSFEDRWEGGIENYIAWMRPRVEAMYKVLKPTGSFYLHCDWHANAYLRIMLNEIFGKQNFRNEIIWCYGIGGRSKKHFGRKHDTIFFYSKDSSYTFNVNDIRLPFKKTHMKIEIDANGRKYSTKKSRSGKVYRYPIDIGKIPEDYWLDIESINWEAKERLGYPTQKPEALLERIIKASSNKGDVVLDAFCGCGTAMVVAHKLKRKWIGIDISPTAIKLVGKRLNNAGAVKDEHYKTIGLPATEKDLRKLKPFEFQNWVMDEMGASVSKRKSGDMGIDGYLAKTLWHERAGIQVKQSDKVGRNIVDNFETALRRAKYKQGYIIAFSFAKGAYEEAARVKNKGELEIKLITVKELLEKRRTLVT